MRTTSRGCTLSRSIRIPSRSIGKRTIGRLRGSSKKDGRGRRCLSKDGNGSIVEEAHGLDVGSWWSFTRPHTMFGTAISVVSVSLMASEPSCWMGTTGSLWKLLQATCSALLMNVTIVGINQIYDVEIDRINKPYLPLASGRMSQRQAKTACIACAILSLAIGTLWWSTPLMCTLVGSLMLGVFYSVEAKGMRWKKHPALAAGCIFIVRAVLVQLGFSMHAQLSTGQAARITRPIALTMVIMSAFSLVIALYKDLPDVEGDRKNTVRTFSVRMGPKTVYHAGMFLLSFMYVSSLVYASTWCFGWRRIVCGALHAMFLLILWIRSREVSLESPSSLYSFYMFVWKLFYAEYLVLPFFGGGGW